MKFRIGDKCIIRESIMTHLIGKIVTIRNLKYYNPPFYDCTIDDMDDCSVVCAEKTLEKI